MRARWSIAALLVAVSVLGAAWWASADLTIHRTVPAMALPDPAVRHGTVTEAEVTIACADGAARYVGEDGSPVGFDATSPLYPSPEQYCEAARSDRATTSFALVAAGAGAGLLVVAEGVVRRRRRTDPAGAARSGAAPDGTAAHVEP